MLKKEITIRLAKPGDEIKVAEMMKEAYKRKAWLYTGRMEIPDKKKIKKMREQYSKKSDSFCFIAIDNSNKKVIGSCFFSFRKTGRLRHRIDGGWGLHPDYFGKGIGTSLLKKALSYAKQKGFKRAEAEATIENKSSWKLAKKCGFKIEGTKKKAFLTDDGRYIETYILGRIL
jgi:RimJ/RimL family protein N-acetyltransferase